MAYKIYFIGKKAFVVKCKINKINVRKQNFTNSGKKTL